MSNYIVRIFVHWDRVVELGNPTPAEVAAEVAELPRAFFVVVSFGKRDVGFDIKDRARLIPDKGITAAQLEVAKSIAAAL